MTALPPRCQRLQQKPMLLVYDIDCGELIAGHRFVARGLSDDGLVEFDTGCPVSAFSFEYELVPGVPPDRAGRSFFDYLVGISYQADVPLPFEPSDGGAVAPFEGGATTHGSRGSWPLPPGARTLRFTLTGDRDSASGVLTVDLQTRVVHWAPTGSQTAL